jgi:hypothetical protein
MAGSMKARTWDLWTVAVNNQSDRSKNGLFSGGFDHRRVASFMSLLVDNL